MDLRVCSVCGLEKTYIRYGKSFKGVEGLTWRCGMCGPCYSAKRKAAYKAIADKKKLKPGRFAHLNPPRNNLG